MAVLSIVDAKLQTHVGVPQHLGRGAASPERVPRSGLVRAGRGGRGFAAVLVIAVEVQGPGRGRRGRTWKGGMEGPVKPGLQEDISMEVRIGLESNSFTT